MSKLDNLCDGYEGTVGETPRFKQDIKELMLELINGVESFVGEDYRFLDESELRKKVEAL